jgi:L-malate glycosyltransferase
MLIAAPCDVPSADGLEVRTVSGSRMRRTLALVRLAREADILHVHGTRAAAWALPAFPLARTVVTFHGLHPLRRPAGTAYLFAGRMFVRLVAALANASIAVSEAEAVELRALAVGRNVHVVRNAVPARAVPGFEERRSAREQLGLANETMVALFLGRLDPAKRPLDAVSAVDGLDGVELIVGGDGPMRAELERVAASNVRILGWRDDPERLLAACDIVLSTSLWEGLSLTLLEAMWANRPIVASRVPGNVEAIGDAGVLVEPGNVLGFRAALIALRESADERSSLAARGRERVAKQFQFETMLDATNAVYRRVLGGGRGRDG